LILRHKPRNRCGNFETQITKLELSVLRPKPGNPLPPWFCGLTKKPNTGFEDKPGETVATNFKTKLEKIVTADFDAKPSETVATGFEAKLTKTIQVVLRPNHSQTIDLDFEA
jgi:hypothetical protein